MQLPTNPEFYYPIIVVLMVTFALWLAPQAIGFKPFALDLNKELDKNKEEKE